MRSADLGDLVEFIAGTGAWISEVIDLDGPDIVGYFGHASLSLTMNTYMSKTVGGSRAADALDSVMHVRPF